MRDEVVLRLGLAGMRAAEITSLRIGDLHLDHDPPTIAWIGKASRSRRLVPGPALVRLLGRSLTAYEEHIGRRLRDDHPVVCRRKPGAGQGQVSWGHPIARTCSIQDIVRSRATQAGLGHLSPHDLRRSAAGILHRARSADGGHLFDLRDIQQVLDHADPATTQRSYLDPLGTGTKERAASYLD
ncbi:MAG TPA: site-specific integrase [Acidimicrobiales bacterium]|nr:site-specific integrase [Acidimicrobiales bacterium]